MANGAAAGTNIRRQSRITCQRAEESPRRPFHPLCRDACPHAQVQIAIAAEDSRLYTEPVARTKRVWQFIGKRGKVSPFHQFAFSSII